MNILRPLTRLMPFLSSAKQFVESALPQDVDALPFWEHLPSLGDDTDKIIESIRTAHPVHATNPNPYYLRRELYKAILWLRTESKRGWVMDQKKGRIGTYEPVLH